jgi:hypothetical protein
MPHGGRHRLAPLAQPALHAGDLRALRGDDIVCQDPQFAVGRLGAGYLDHLHGLLVVGIMSVTNLTSTSLWGEVMAAGAAVSVPWLQAASNATAPKASRKRRILWDRPLLVEWEQAAGGRSAYVREIPRAIGGCACARRVGATARITGAWDDLVVTLATMSPARTARQAAAMATPIT